MDVLPATVLIDRRQSTPLGEQLVTQLREAIVQGHVASGERLPASRELCKQLALSRNTVVQAYEQLAAEGLVLGLGRRGTVVALRERPRPSSLPRLIGRLPPPSERLVPAALDWRLGQASATPMPLSAWRAACREGGRSLPPTGYGDPAGDIELREAITESLVRHRGLHVTSAQVVVTQGASSAIELIARLMLRPGDLCIVENPGYVHAADILRRSGANVRAVTVDADGIDVDACFSGRSKPALMHITPAHHYPLGWRMSPGRRRQVLAGAERCGALVIENEYDHEFIHDGANHAPLFASRPDLVLLVSTFAKAISPSLRIGFIVAQPEIAARLADLVASQRRHVSWPVQRNVSWLIRTGELDRHLRRVRRHTHRLRERMIGALLAHKSKGLQFGGEGGGLHVCMRMSNPTSTDCLAQTLRAQGVALNTLDDFKSATSDFHGALFAYGHMAPSDLEHALAVLDKAVRVASRVA